MKKNLLLFLILLLCMTGCAKTSVSEDAKLFKEEYESFNNEKNDYFAYRNIELVDDNPIIYSTDAKIVKKIENKESFIVYFGDPECPWCRSIVEQALLSAKENNIKQIYYVRFWNGFHKEIIRDVYELDDNNTPVVKEKGSDAYYKLLEYLDGVLKEYTLKDKNNDEIQVNEKRIFLPNFVAIINGEAKELIQGISDNQESYNSELTKEIIKDEKKVFDDFFSKYSNKLSNTACTKDGSKDC